MNAAAERLIAQLSQCGVPMLVEPAADDPQAAVDRDMVLLDAVLALEQPAELLRVWQNRRCLVASSSQSRHPLFSHARTMLADCPVVHRRSGGTAVVHRDGVLNLSLFVREQGSPVSLDAAYAGFGQLLIAALGRLGLEVDLGPVPNAHCDGRFNLRWRQYKLAGTAGFRRQRLGRVAWLIHASLAMSGPIEQDLALIERFESALGAEPRYRADAHATLEHALTASSKSLT